MEDVIEAQVQNCLVFITFLPAWQQFGGAQMLTLLGKGAVGAGSETEAQDLDTDAKNML